MTAVPAQPPKSNSGPFGIPPGGPWFIFQATGTIQRQSNPVLAVGLANSGWVGFATQAEAVAALAYSKAHGAPSVGQAAGDAGHSVANAATNALGLPQFSNTRDFVVRTVKVLLGMALIIIGINSLMHSEGISVPKLPPVVPV